MEAISGWRLLVRIVPVIGIAGGVLHFEGIENGNCFQLGSRAKRFSSETSELRA